MKKLASVVAVALIGSAALSSTGFAAARHHQRQFTQSYDNSAEWARPQLAKSAGEYMYPNEAPLR
jgi:hypothetical protein